MINFKTKLSAGDFYNAKVNSQVSPMWVRHFLAFSLLLIVAICWGSSARIWAKAYAAQWLIADAWQNTLVDGGRHQPWQWADTWPVARLRSNLLKKDLFVLAGASGTSLAFGPGHSDGSALPNTPGTSVISGHRDTHFSFLEHIRPGDLIQLQNARGEWQSYIVEDLTIRHIDKDPLTIDMSNNQLMLITCYPFHNLSIHGPLRYVVTARPQ